VATIPVGVKIYHLRNIHGPHADDFLPRGGITIAVRIDGDCVIAAIGVCGHRHTFDRKQGREVSLGRLDKLFEKRVVRFAKIFDLSRFGDDSEFERALSIAHILVSESRLKGRQRRSALAVVECNHFRMRFLRDGPVGYNFKFDTENISPRGTMTGRIQCKTPNIVEGGSNG